MASLTSLFDEVNSAYEVKKTIQAYKQDPTLSAHDQNGDTETGLLCLHLCSSFPGSTTVLPRCSRAYAFIAGTRDKSIAGKDSTP